MSDTEQKPLAPRAKEALQFIAANSHLFSPTVREIAAGMHIRSPHGVTQHLKLLERSGLIRRTPGKARNIEITEAGRKVLT